MLPLITLPLLCLGALPPLLLCCPFLELFDDDDGPPDDEAADDPEELFEKWLFTAAAIISNPEAPLMPTGEIAVFGGGGCEENPISCADDALDTGLPWFEPPIPPPIWRLNDIEPFPPIPFGFGLPPWFDESPPTGEPECCEPLFECVDAVPGLPLPFIPLLSIPPLPGKPWAVAGGVNIPPFPVLPGPNPPGPENPYR